MIDRLEDDLVRVSCDRQLSGCALFILCDSREVRRPIDLMGRAWAYSDGRHTCPACLSHRKAKEVAR